MYLTAWFVFCCFFYTFIVFVILFFNNKKMANISRYIGRPLLSALIHSVYGSYTELMADIKPAYILYHNNLLKYSKNTSIKITEIKYILNLYNIY